MLSENLKWYFPSSVSQAVELIQKPGVILHAGGTRILKTQSKNIVGLVDVGNLKLNYIKFKNNSFHIGSATTFNDVIKFSKENNCLKMLGAALSQAASTPLRNRITVGGSLKDFPLWSNLYAPLITIDAKIEIRGDKSGIYSVEEYVSDGIIKSKHIIKEIIVPENENIIWKVKRFALLKFEYPLFNIAIAFKMNGKIIEDAKLVITGVKNRFKRFKKAEKFLTGQKLSNNLSDEIEKFIEPKFVSDYKYSASYKETVAKVYFNELLSEIIRENL
ncbi:MAG: FAD binding domain-containing protein [Bacteroidetes bacterium]|nr:FAD binding domain-containing protein [Bacteroidota bacterium]